MKVLWTNQSLQDPLIPKTSRREFMLAATNDDEVERDVQLRKAIDDLPQPHRDTLAYLCVHWLKVRFIFLTCIVKG